ncbi:hypothetical protein B0H19DRAFT_1276328 [Mycena capillaripes]|nr:hypothetical protein B0H19DRAFT_1276328 [Mycena capillaripes]
MPGVSKKKKAARRNWAGAVNSIKSGTKRALAILTPRKKRRRIGTDKENDAEIISNDASSGDIPETRSFETRSCPDDDFFLTPGPSVARGFGDLPADARSHFGLFSTGTKLSPSKSSSLNRFWSDFTPRLLNKFSPSRKSIDPRVFDDDESILAQKSPRPARIFRLTPSSESLDSDDPHFQFTPAARPRTSVDSMSLDSASIHSDSTPAGFPPMTDADLADATRQRAHSAAARDGRIREAPAIEAALDALKDIGTVLHPRRKKGPGYVDPHLDPFTKSRIEGIQSLLALYTHTGSSTYGQWKKASTNAAITLRCGTYCARVLRRLARAYITDRDILPENPYGNWNETLLVSEDLS